MILGVFVFTYLLKYIFCVLDHSSPILLRKVDQRTCGTSLDSCKEKKYSFVDDKNQSDSLSETSIILAGMYFLVNVLLSSLRQG